MTKSVRKKKRKNVRTGKLRIADHWNAISIIAKSQANPLKAVAEFVGNSIDAGAEQVVIVRGKKRVNSISRSVTMVRESPKINKAFPIFVAWQHIFAILSRDTSSQKG